ncbi:MAG TPA: guanine deaminase [Candidatus Limnocylindria bacterium]
MTGAAALPERPPFVVRARLLTPLPNGEFLHEDDARVEVDAAGRIAAVAPWTDAAADPSVQPAHDLRPWVLMPGLVDLHVHLPQIPNAGLGAGLGLLEWLERYIFPLEHAFDRATAEQQAPVAFRALARAGTTTIAAYAALWPESTDACFAAAETHGIRAVIGKVMMDRLTYDESIAPGDILETSLRQSAELCERWHGADDGRLRYAFTPRFAVSCSTEMLAESARLAAHYGAYWQTHLSEDANEIHEVQRCFPGARDYLDVYERAGGLGERALLAHAIHLSDSEVQRLAASGARVAHCPASNLFLSSGMMPAGRYLDAGVRMGLGSDLAAGPELSLFSVMRAAAVTQRVLVLNGTAGPRPPLAPLDWLRMATLDGARALGMGDQIGSIQVGKEADLVLVDASLTAPLPGLPDPAEPEELVSRLIFRPHPDMVRGAWVRGKRLPA